MLNAFGPSEQTEIVFSFLQLLYFPFPRVSPWAHYPSSIFLFYVLALSPFGHHLCTTHVSKVFYLPTVMIQEAYNIQVICIPFLEKRSFHQFKLYCKRTWKKKITKSRCNFGAIIKSRLLCVATGLILFCFFLYGSLQSDPHSSIQMSFDPQGLESNKILRKSQNICLACLSNVSQVTCIIKYTNF